jgi:hypothetical protein
VVLLRECALPELLRVKHHIDARTDPEKGQRETVEWIKRLRDMRSPHRDPCTEFLSAA